MQNTSTILMVRPIKFGFNEQTAENNAFQKRGFENKAQEEALKEFDAFVALLRQNDVEVLVAQDTEIPHTPDSIFPNNWISTHSQGRVVLYPMCAANRRLERKESVLELIKSNYEVNEIIDLTSWEQKGQFLEGTGSMVLDRDNKIVYACKSSRTDEAVLSEFCEKLDYDFFLFDALDQDGRPIYHTNVMMCLGEKFVVACLDSICNISHRESFIEMVEEYDKELIEISLEQMENFAGNMLEIKNNKGNRLLVMSSTAYKSLSEEQVKMLSAYCKIITPDISSIENNGGGSARCMMAEINFL